MVKDNSNIIRPLVICVFRNGDKILACLGEDNVKNNKFYRPLGGMIEFGERSDIALRREIVEETGEEITDIVYLGTLENIFTYNGKPHHEIVIVYDAKFINNELYDKEEVDVEEVDIWYKAHWLSIEDCKTGKHLIYPDGLLDLL
jgi:8-oxo-dGTP pyrophosphatase MutT (NUDIX family)